MQLFHLRPHLLKRFSKILRYLLVSGIILVIPTSTLVISCSSQAPKNEEMSFIKPVYDANDKLTILDFNKSVKYNLNNFLNNKENIFKFINANAHILFNSLSDEIHDASISINNNDDKYSSFNLSILTSKNKSLDCKITGFSPISNVSNKEFSNTFFNNIKTKLFYVNSPFNTLNSEEIIRILNNKVDLNLIITNTINQINSSSSNAYIFNEIKLSDFKFGFKDSQNYRKKYLTLLIDNNQVINKDHFVSDVIFEVDKSINTINFLKSSFDSNDHLVGINFNDVIKTSYNSLKDLNKKFLIDNSLKLFNLTTLPSIKEVTVEINNIFDNNNYIRLSVWFYNEPGTISTNLINFVPCSKPNSSLISKLLVEKLNKEINFINDYELNINKVDRQYILNKLNRDKNLVNQVAAEVKNMINDDQSKYYITNISQHDLEFDVKLIKGFYYLYFKVNNSNIIDDGFFQSNICIYTKTNINNNVIINESANEFTPVDYGKKIHLDTSNLAIQNFNSFQEIYDDLVSKFNNLGKSNSTNQQNIFLYDLNVWNNSFIKYFKSKFEKLSSDNVMKIKTSISNFSLTNINYDKSMKAVSFNITYSLENVIIDDQDNTYASFIIDYEFSVKNAKVLPMLFYDSYSEVYVAGWTINQVDKIDSVIKNPRIIKNDELINQSNYQTDIKNCINNWSLQIEALKDLVNKVISSKFSITPNNLNRYYSSYFQDQEESMNYLNNMLLFLNSNENISTIPVIYSAFLNTGYQLILN